MVVFRLLAPCFLEGVQGLLGQGKVATVEKLKENPDMCKEIVAKIMAQNKDGRQPLVVGSEEEKEEELTDE